MAVTIRLMRFGKKKYPTYRIVVLDKRKKRDGAYIENLGQYNPMVEPPTITLNQERYLYWAKVGAVISEGVRKLALSRKGVFPKMEVAVKEQKETEVVEKATEEQEVKKKLAVKKATKSVAEKPVKKAPAKKKA